MTTTKIDLKQREHLASLVDQEKREEKERLEEQNDATKEAIVRLVARESGAETFLTKDADLVKNIEALQAARRENADELQELGFDISDGEPKLRWNAPDKITKAIAKRVTEARRPIEKSLKKYDLATARIWAATSSEELQKAVDGILLVG